ncbi:sulfurtransferase complex subunit TusC [Zooshikella harenae]|uniref:Sulfurtransferase complex subunit TusC n=1 Tax=Zooshikella harenae TaxID=2827238 RepID=A0ABS5ZER6_9GAMM|nr:sulfurtransferase complex subunit TusC [Zooshikella harenae]MBU2712233.1 sulfurtransferase complex subunit TusC [Zooshikella harenae]
MVEHAESKECKKEKKIAVLITQPPYQSIAGKEGLDLALVAATFEQFVSLFFIGDGVWQLVKNQQPEVISQKNISASFGALGLYGIEHVYTDASALKNYNLTEQDLVTTTQVIALDELGSLIASHDIIINF